MIRGLNHLTLAVSDVARSARFYRDVLGLKQRAIWEAGAYFEAGSLWLCLSLDPAVGEAERADYTHFAFDVATADFAGLAERIAAQAVVWKDDESEGASLYFLDPDGHRLELHVGTLDSRLHAWRGRAGIEFVD